MSKDLAVISKKVIKSTRMTLAQIMNVVCPLPGDAIVFGVIHENDLPFPMLWNVRDQKSPNIVIWDKLARQGLRILKTIAEYVFKHHPTCGYKGSDVEFLVLTLYSEDWGELNAYGMGMMGKTSCIGIIPFGSEIAEKVMYSLARWVNEPAQSSAKHPTILMIDGLENLNKMSVDFKRNLRYVMYRGRNKNIYTIGTASKNNFAKVQDWLDGFQAEINGRDFDDEFDMSEGKDTVVFYAPRTEMI